MEFRKSNELREKAFRFIPGGAHTYSKGDDQFPELSPGFIARGKGTKAWDVDGNEFIDWGMGLRSVILGHAFDPVLDAVKVQLELGSNFTRPSPLEAEVAELLVELIPAAEMVKFAKNGSDVTTAAVKLARAYTGRDLVVRCFDHPFFSVDDWFIGDTEVDSGIPQATKQLTKHFRYNDIESLEQLINANSGQIACVIMEAATTTEPNPGFLQRVRELTAANGIIFIMDEIISGFRWDLGGAQSFYGVTPDLATFGKGIANGFSLAALVGKREIMELGGLKHSKPRVFLLSTTNGAETHSLAAAKASLEFMRDNGLSKHLWSVGTRLTEGFNRISDELGLSSRVKMAGYPCSPYQVFLDAEGKTDFNLRTLYLQETIKHGVLIPYIAPSYSHSESDIERTLEASRMALRVVAQAVEAGSTERFLVGPSVKPVFRKFN